MACDMFADTSLLIRRNKNHAVAKRRAFEYVLHSSKPLVRHRDSRVKNFDGNLGRSAAHWAGKFRQNLWKFFMYGSTTLLGRRMGGKRWIQTW
jgi:hypothetical protein